MNLIKHHVYTLEFDTWEPFEKDVQDELDKIIFGIKTKCVLGHAAAVRLIKNSEVRQ